MVKFNIGDFAATSQFEFLEEYKEKASGKLERLVTFFEKNDCIDLAIRLMENTKPHDGEFMFWKTCEAFKRLKEQEVEISGDVQKDEQVKLIKNLVGILRSSLFALNGSSSADSDAIAKMFYNLLLELKTKKNSQSQSSKLWSGIGWKTGLFCAVTLVLIILLSMYWLELIY